MLNARVAWLAALALGCCSVLGCRSLRPVTVHLIGDSTMANKPLEGNPERGWGQALPGFLAERATVANHAINGRSTKSFIDEGRWDEVVRALRPGDYVFIQFGHNDAKKEDPRRFAAARTTYKENLARFVREAREKRARPVLCTPVMRRRFDDAGRFFDTHGEYPDVVRQVAREMHVPLVDLHRESERVIVEQGAEGSKKLFLWIAPGQYPSCAKGRQDDTHFSQEGATRMAGLAVAGIRRAKLPLARYLRQEPVPAPLTPKPNYLFAYFRGNGEDGLHLAVSHDALNWRPLRGERPFLAPTVGRDKLMRDPFIFLGPDGVFHLVWTVSWRERGIGYASSRDLIHWSEQRYLGVMEHEPEAINCWAPEIAYDEARGEFVVFWATTIPGRFADTDGQSKEGPPQPGLNHRLYCVTSRDMQAFSETRLFFDQGFNVIDATIVRDGARSLMFLKDETAKPFTPQKNIRVTTASSVLGPWAPVSPPITGAFWAEGPSALKVGDLWVVYFDKYGERQYGAVVSRDLEKWEDVSEQLHMPAGARHGTAFRVSDAVLEALTAVD